MSIIPALGRSRQQIMSSKPVWADSKCKTSLRFIARTCLETQEKGKKKRKCGCQGT
jgi:hypothetical protein